MISSIAFSRQTNENQYSFSFKWGSKGTGDGQFLLLLGVDLDSHNKVYVVDRKTTSVQEFSNNVTFIPPRLEPEIQSGGNSSVLEDIELDQYNNVYLTNRANNDIKEYKMVQ
jgi:hypothetical protein